ncbi:MBL fold metallo-hydrolase [Paenibacillus thermoaerophilus]|jgi:hydroxyacylglutathione hydrolase|uniref:MBL fold metallo-hydrolase n=1 Tax=Paenibacillus thermoaerophilus TaxID=1215385 RepID=A0ABW2V4C4_9BACL|nr:MBL fold metallo-hydrolase [Paenibacillus thermoaerophilus]TMV16119.1 MBL fold metallo-hydrolase [Paenibacillus thermoaerophilus]
MAALHIESFPLGPLETNAYLLTKEGSSRAVVIDPGMKPGKLVSRLDEAGLELEAIVLTHAHFDHIGGVDLLRKRGAGCPVYLHEKEAAWLSDGSLNGSLRWPELGGEIVTDAPDFTLRGGERLTLLGETFQVFHTPGHSPGSISLLTGHHLFAGDVLFRGSVGRTDLPGGSWNELLNSIHGVLFELNDDIRVYPGHGPGTTIGYEKEHNPYV